MIYNVNFASYPVSHKGSETKCETDQRFSASMVSLVHSSTTVRLHGLC